MKIPHLALSICVILGFSICCAAADARRLNIVFFLADDRGYMDIGANNPRTFYQTPNIDALAKRGMRHLTNHALVPRAEINMKDLMVTHEAPEKVFVAP